MESFESELKPEKETGGNAKPGLNKLGEGIREIVPSVRHIELKFKEYLGRITQGEFDELLQYDFREALHDNPPIEGVFAPEEELAKIKSLPKEQRREALTTFKENLARQRKAFAACRVFIERSIEFNHEIPRIKLSGWVEKFSERYGFTEKQRLIAEELISEYYKRRQRALKIRRRFPENAALVKELTGVKFDRDEKLDVSVGPMTIDIGTEGFNAGRIYERSDKPVIFRHGGFAGQSIHVKPVYYIVINQDKWIRKSYGDPTGEKTRRHEYEHQKNRLFRAVLEDRFRVEESVKDFRDYTQEHNPEVKKVILKEYLRQRRADALELVKDEITACLYDRDLSTLQKDLGYLFFSGRGPYDYLAYFRDQRKDDVLYQETAQKVLVREYQTIIERAVESYAELVEEGGYSIQKAIALLTDKPLEEWPKTIRRLLEQEKKKVFL